MTDDRLLTNSFSIQRLFGKNTLSTVDFSLSSSLFDRCNTVLVRFDHLLAFGFDQFSLRALDLSSYNGKQRRAIARVSSIGRCQSYGSSITLRFSSFSPPLDGPFTRLLLRLTVNATRLSMYDPLCSYHIVGSERRDTVRRFVERTNEREKEPF